MSILTAFYRKGRRCFTPMTTDDLSHALGRVVTQGEITRAIREGHLKSSRPKWSDAPRVYELTPKGKTLAAQKTEGCT